MKKSPSASTHLYWDPAFADVKLSQAKKLIEECRRFRADRERATNGVNKVRVVVGARISTAWRRADVYREMNAAFPSVSADAEPAHTNVTPNFTATIDYIFVSDGVRVVSVQEQPGETPATGRRPSQRHHPSDHSARRRRVSLRLIDTTRRRRGKITSTCT